MIIQEKLTKEVVLTGTEAHIIRHCLEYCLHRFKKHGKCGLSKVVGRQMVEKLIEEIKNI